MQVALSKFSTMCVTCLAHLISLYFNAVTIFYDKYKFWRSAPTKYNRPSPDFFFRLWRNSPTRARTASFLRFIDHTQWHTTVGTTPLDEWSARRRDLTTPKTDIRTAGGIRTRNPSKQAAANPRLRPLGHDESPWPPDPLHLQVILQRMFNITENNELLPVCVVDKMSL